MKESESSQKYFRVLEQRIRGRLLENEVYSDGEEVEGTEEVVDRQANFLTGYIVEEWTADDPFEVNEKHYSPRDFYKIIEEHPAGEWQNDRW